MKILTIDEINKNCVDTINQYKVLQYLKKNLNINCFKVSLYDKDTIKVMDSNDEIAFFKYNEETNNIDFEESKKEFEMKI